MKRFTLNFLGSVLAFGAGVLTASSWHSDRHALAVDPGATPVIERCPPNLAPPLPPPPLPSSLTEPADREFVFAQGRLRLVPEKVQLKSESLHYEIDVKYPQIEGEDNPQIRKINQHMKALATDKYQWPLNSSKEEVRRAHEMYRGLFNSVNLDYEVSVATDSFLSIFFMGYSYSIGAAHAVQESVAVNYDLTSGRQLQLTDIFKPDSRYLAFISEYCKRELSKDGGGAALFAGALAPTAKNFESWHITSRGVTFTFDACKVFACAEGDKAVEIPFSDLQGLLNPGIPGKFKIVYP